MAAFDTFEQVHPLTLDPEDPDTIADFRPFRIEIGFDKAFRQIPDCKGRPLRMAE